MDMITEWKKASVDESTIRHLNERELRRRVEALRQEVFAMYVSVRAVQCALGRDELALTDGLCDVAMRNKRITDDVRRLRVALAVERDEEPVVGAPI